MLIKLNEELLHMRMKSPKGPFKSIKGGRKVSYFSFGGGVLLAVIINLFFVFNWKCPV